MIQAHTLERELQQPGTTGKHGVADAAPRTVVSNLNQVHGIAVLENKLCPRSSKHGMSANRPAVLDGWPAGSAQSPAARFHPTSARQDGRPHRVS